MTSLQFAITTVIFSLGLWLLAKDTPPSPVIEGTFTYSFAFGLIFLLVQGLLVGVIRIVKGKELPDDRYGGRWNGDIIGYCIVAASAFLLISFEGNWDFRWVFSITQRNRYFSNFAYAMLMFSLFQLGFLLMHYIGRYLVKNVLNKQHTK